MNDFQLFLHFAIAYMGVVNDLDKPYVLQRTFIEVAPLFKQNYGGDSTILKPPEELAWEYINWLRLGPKPAWVDGAQPLYRENIYLDDVYPG